MLVNITTTSGPLCGFQKFQVGGNRIEPLTPLPYQGPSALCPFPTVQQLSKAILHAKARYLFEPEKHFRALTLTGNKPRLSNSPKLI